MFWCFANSGVNYFMDPHAWFSHYWEVDTIEELKGNPPKNGPRLQEFLVEEPIFQVNSGNFAATQDFPASFWA